MPPPLPRLMLPVLLVAGAPLLTGFAGWLHAQVSVQSDYVFVGEPFTVRIRVRGTVVPNQPDTSVVKDFAIEFECKEWNPSRGDKVFICRFRAKRAGVLHVPPIPVSGGGVTTRTPRTTIRARPVEETEATLTLELSAKDCYVGQRIAGHLNLRSRGDGRGYEFDAPFLHDARFVAVLPTRGFVSHPTDGFVRVRVNRMLLLSGWLARWRHLLRRLGITPREEFERSNRDVTALRRYLASIAGLKPGSATLADVRRSQKFSRLSHATLASLSAVLDADDAERFGGAATQEAPDIGSLVRRINAELAR